MSIKDLCYKKMFNYSALQLRINLKNINILCTIIFLFGSQPEEHVPLGVHKQ
jgi:hypothetical protein